GFAVWRIVTAKNLPADADAVRTGHIIVLVGLIFSMATVHLWDANVVYFFFFLGAGLWLADSGGAGASPDTPSGTPPSGPPGTSRELDTDTAAPPTSGTPYSRFAPHSRRTGPSSTPPPPRARAGTVGGGRDAPSSGAPPRVTRSGAIPRRPE
ncbi:MAG: hypothetical protein AAGJ28_24870, partial [Pseudomonadota bacterium]